MQESLHTISPFTSPMDQMKSKRSLMTALIFLVIIIAGGAIGYTIYLKNKKISGAPMTDLQKQELAEDLRSRGALGGLALSDDQKQELVKAQIKQVAEAPTLTDIEKAEIIKQMNSR